MLFSSSASYSQVFSTHWMASQWWFDKFASCDKRRARATFTRGFGLESELILCAILLVYQQAANHYYFLRTDMKMLTAKRLFKSLRRDAVALRATGRITCSLYEQENDVTQGPSIVLFAVPTLPDVQALPAIQHDRCCQITLSSHILAVRASVVSTSLLRHVQ